MASVTGADGRIRHPAHFSGGLSTPVWWGLIGAALVVLLEIAVSSKVLADPDTQWHVRIGQLIWAAGRVPVTDTISYTFAGQPWIAKEWLSQVLLAAAYATGGWPAVVVLTAAAVAAAVHMIMVYCGRTSGAAWGVLVGIVVMLFVAPTVFARPHTIVSPIIVLWTLAMVRGAESQRPPWHMLPLMVLWANMHAGFTAGLLIAAAMGGEAVLRATPAARVAVAGRWLMFGVGCLAASALTPYGVKPLLVNFEMAGGSESMRVLGEWQPLAVNPVSALMLLVAALCLYALAERPRIHAARVLLLAVLTYAMVKHTRFTMLFGLVAPLLAGAVVFQRVDPVARRLGLFQQRVLPDTVWAPALAGGVAVLALALLIARPPALPATVAPVEALASVPAELRQERVFNSYDLGGFLAHQRVKTFVDGRSDQLFLGGFLATMLAATEAREPALLQQLLDRHGIVWAIVRTDFPEVHLFPRLTGWRLHHRGPTAHVYVREGTVLPR